MKKNKSTISCIELFQGLEENLRGAYDELSSIYNIVIDWGAYTPKLPTVEKAASLMGVTEDDIRRMLSSKSIYTVDSKYLDYLAVEKLADRYVEKMHRYFENSMSSVSMLSEAGDDFWTFASHYSIWNRVAFDWSEIDEFRLRQAFINELVLGTSLEYMYCTVDRRVADFRFRESMRRIVKSLLYHMKPARILKGCRGYFRGFVIQFIIANRFHIFTSESDSHNGFDTIMRRLEFNNPHGAIPSPVAA